MTKVRAFGKVILFGEHAVVYGHPAIAAALDRGVEAEAHASHELSLFIAPWNLSITPSRTQTGPYAQIACALAELLDAYGPSKAAHVDAFAAIPAGAGLGCSAALAVAIVKSLDHLNERERSLEDIVNVSLAWERVFHGNPSGIDSVLAARGGVVRFVRGQAVVPVIPRVPLRFAIASTDENASTKSMVDSVARQREKTPARVEQTFEAISAIVRNAQLAIEQGDTLALGQLLDMNHTLLSGLVLSTTRLEELRALAKAHHALGAKLTGSGGGGALVTLCPESPQERASLLKALCKFSDDVFEMTVQA
jgi:mevalonate kinase